MTRISTTTQIDALVGQMFDAIAHIEGDRVGHGSR